jgi:hypothetical protein
MTDEDVYRFFLDAIDVLAPEDHEAAMLWLAQRQMAWTLVREMETKGLAALLPSEP